jgi:hypothetical protein
VDTSTQVPIVPENLESPTSSNVLPLNVALLMIGLPDMYETMEKA